MKRARRAILLSSLFLLGGAVVSVGIAEGIGCSGLVRWLPDAPWRFVEAGGMHVEVKEMKGAGWRCHWWDVQDRESIILLQSMYDGRSGTFDGQLRPSYPHLEPLESLPYWSDLRNTDHLPATARIGGRITFMRRMEAGIGWPLASFSIDWDPGNPRECRGGRMFITPSKTQRHLLSWRPIPLGLAADTLFWSICLAAPFASFHLLKATLRRRRGACARCGYDLRGLGGGGGVCPECGGAWRARGAV